MGREAQYVIRVTEEERSALQDLMGTPRAAAGKLLRARMVRKADVDGPGWSDPQSGEAFAVGVSTVHRLRQRLVEEGLAAALLRRPRTQKRVPTLDGEKAARLVAIACSSPPEGRTRGTLPRLADHLVERDIVDAISAETGRQTLNKTRASRG